MTSIFHYDFSSKSVIIHLKLASSKQSASMLVSFLKLTYLMMTSLHEIINTNV